ncbi:vWA domain-containing protein [Streptomyces sp. JNUCC 64]
METAPETTPEPPEGAYAEPDEGPPHAEAHEEAHAEAQEGNDEGARRWRLVLGAAADPDGPPLDGRDATMDRALAALYDHPAAPGGDGRGGGDGDRTGGLGASAPSVARWLGDVRACFPAPVVRVMQRDALDRLGLSALLLEPELLEAVEADVHLAGTLLSLARAMPERTRETAREVVRRVVADLEARLAAPTRAAVRGALDRGARTRRPRPRDIDWNRTIAANLAHYLPERRTLVPERLIGRARASAATGKEVILCVDQSGSMAPSVVYASVFGAVLASVRSLDTRLIAFDTSVVDLTDALADPVDVLFGTRLGGGTDIGRALAHCQRHVTRPADTVLVLISDLYDGGVREETLRRAAAITASGTRLVVLLALSDEGAPAYDHENAAAFAALGAPAFACTPDLFPEVMAAALEGRPLPVPGTEDRPPTG